MESTFNILFATDYSESVMNAERYAMQFAKHTHSYLRIIHVFKPAIGIPVTFNAETIDYAPLQYQIEKLQDHVRELCRSIHINPEEVNYDCVVREGNIREQIMLEAEESSSDLIIAGTHGAGLLQKLMLGSHTWDIIKNAEIPVLAIPEDALFTGLHNIVFATEYREEDIRAIRFLYEIANSLNANLTLLHVSNHTISEELEMLLLKKFITEVKNKIQYADPDIRLVHDTDKVNGLNYFCIANKVHWLAMSTQKTNWLEELIYLDGDKTKRMSFDTHVPLFIIPDTYYLVTHPEMMLRTM